MNKQERLLGQLAIVILLAVAFIGVREWLNLAPPEQGAATATQPEPQSQDPPSEINSEAEALYQQGLQLALNDSKGAQSALAEAVALDPAYRERANTLQNALLNAGRSTDPAHQAALIGQALAALGEWELAKAAFEASAAQAPEYAEAWAYLGEAQTQLGENPLPALQTAIDLDPDSISANYFFALYWRREEMPELALIYLQHAATLAPESTALQADIGDTLVEMGNLQDARDHFERLVELTPDDPNAWLLLAGYAINNEVFVAEAGIPAARQAIVLRPNDPVALTLLGRGYALLEQPLLAARFYQDALSADAAYGPAYYYFGLLRLAQENHAEAQALLEQAVDLLGDTGVGARAAEVLKRYFSNPTENN
jgi:tetratricopeptide (TPR) repeat protein